MGLKNSEPNNNMQVKKLRIRTLVRTIRQEGLIPATLIILFNKLERYFKKKDGKEEEIPFTKPIDRSLLRPIKQEGLIQGSLRMLYDRLRILNINSNKKFDRKYGVDTAEHIEPQKQELLGSNRDQTLMYYPSSLKVVRNVIRRLNIDYRDFVFVDVGSGKGKVLFCASDYPFKKIIGVESSITTCKIAEQNLTRYHSKSQKCKNIEVINTDILTFNFPWENTVYYLYNPFVPFSRVYSKFLNKLSQSIQVYPRRIFVVYTSPVSHKLFEQFGFLRELEKYDVLLSSHSWHLYEINKGEDKTPKPVPIAKVKAIEGDFGFSGLVSGLIL